jgi:hypothetical protein
METNMKMQRGEIRMWVMDRTYLAQVVSSQLGWCALLVRLNGLWRHPPGVGRGYPCVRSPSPCLVLTVHCHLRYSGRIQIRDRRQQRPRFSWFFPVTGSKCDSSVLWQDAVTIFRNLSTSQQSIYRLKITGQNSFECRCGTTQLVQCVCVLPDASCGRAI